jgi:hypothetical protein
MNKNYSMMMLFVVGFFCVVSDINSAPNKARTTRVEALQYKRFGLTPKAKARLRGSRRSKEFSQTVQALQKRQKKTILQSSNCASFTKKTKKNNITIIFRFYPGSCKAERKISTMPKQSHITWMDENIG